MSFHKQSHAVSKYLRNYSEHEALLLECLPKQYGHTVVIPLYDESFDVIVRLLNSNFSFTDSYSCHSIVFILVVNCPEEGDEQAAARTVALLDQLTEWARPVLNTENVAYGEFENGNGIIIIDRCSDSKRIDKKQGVGLARKIGADLACYLIFTKAVIGPWIHSTDGDVILPPDYFSGVSRYAPASVFPGNSKHTPAALIYPFNHIPEKNYEVASALYDWSLRYYVECIREAGSSYDYHTIGSLIAVDFVSYAKVRGFPKRSGGEDFYLLNKLAKVGQIVSLEAPVINVAARPSQRVPFGTGPAICKITETKNAIENHLFYHPGIFRQLKIVYLLINNSWDLSKKMAPARVNDIVSALDLSAVHSPINAATIGALDTLGFFSAWTHAVKQSSNVESFVKQMTIWFDAFKTLKFVHILRDHDYPSLTLKQVLQNTQILSDDLRVRATLLTSIPK